MTSMRFYEVLNSIFAASRLSKVVSSALTSIKRLMHTSYPFAFSPTPCSPVREICHRTAQDSPRRANHPLAGFGYEGLAAAFLELNKYRGVTDIDKDGSAELDCIQVFRDAGNDTPEYLRLNCESGVISKICVHCTYESSFRGINTWEMVDDTEFSWVAGDLKPKKGVALCYDGRYFTNFEP